jgi:hypothetical protein
MQFVPQVQISCLFNLPKYFNLDADLFIVLSHPEMATREAIPGLKATLGTLQPPAQ